MTSGRVSELFLKRAHRAPMQPVDEVRAIAGLGLDGDVGADAASPRHVLLLGRPALRALAATGAELRGNLVVSDDVERLPSGTVLRIGDVRLRLTIWCEPCARLEAVRPGLARAALGRRGYLARVLSSGTIARGAGVEVEPATLRPLDPDWRARVREIASRVPTGRRPTFGRLATIAGVHRSYCRAFARVVGPGPDVGTRGGEPWDGADYYRADERALPPR